MPLTELAPGLLKVALAALSARILVVLTLLLTGGVFAWVLLEPTVLRIIVAGIWSLSIFIPILFHSQRSSP